MTAVLPDFAPPTPDAPPDVEGLPPAPRPARSFSAPRWLPAALAIGLAIVMVATTATALVRAGDRSARLAETRRTLADTQKTLDTTRTTLDETKRDLDKEKVSLAQAKSALTKTEADFDDLTECVDSLMLFIGAAMDGDVATATAALRTSNCDDVLEDLDDRARSAFA